MPGVPPPRNLAAAHAVDGIEIGPAGSPANTEVFIMFAVSCVVEGSE